MGGWKLVLWCDPRTYQPAVWFRHCTTNTGYTRAPLKLCMCLTRCVIGMWGSQCVDSWLWESALVVTSWQLSDSRTHRLYVQQHFFSLLPFTACLKHVKIATLSLTLQAGRTQTGRLIHPLPIYLFNDSLNSWQQYVWLDLAINKNVLGASVNTTISRSSQCSPTGVT